MADSSPTLKFPAVKRPREDETTRTLLERAIRRAARVSERCRASATLRPPEPGPTDRIDPARLRRVQPTPMNTKREDSFELGLVQVLCADDPSADEPCARRRV